MIQTAWIEAGRIVEDGPTRTVLSQPRSAFAARIAGIDLIAGVADAGGLRTAGGLRVHGIVDPDCAPGASAVAVFSPAAVAVHVTDPTGSPRNHLRVTVAELEPRGELIRVHSGEISGSTGGLVADITAASAADLELVPGKEVYFAIKATEVAIYPSAGATTDTRV